MADSSGGSTGGGIARKVRLALIVWMLIGATTAMLCAVFLPFYLGFPAMFAVFLLSRYWIRKRVMRNIGFPAESTRANLQQENTSFMDRLRNLGKTYKYYCGSCGFSHDLRVCPKCGSYVKKMR